MPSVTGIIGGSGFYTMSGAADPDTLEVATPFSDTPVIVYRSRQDAKTLLFLPRHGSEHGIPPHRINYRANIWALRESGAEAILAVNVVGGIADGLDPGMLVVPDQLIDYTWGRPHTYFDTLEGGENHIDFTVPYDNALRQVLVEAAAIHDMPCRDGGVYGCTQGPRLETAAEIRKLQRDGCDVVGMTSMPEAALARELHIPYACLALVVNRAAGLGEETISFADIVTTLEQGVAGIRQLLLSAVSRIS